MHVKFRILLMYKFPDNQWSINDNLNMYINNRLRMYTSDYTLI